MPGFVASLIPTSREHPNIVGWVASLDDMSMAIICYRIDGEWVPQYGVKGGTDSNTFSEKLELPSCFELDPLAANALEQFYFSVAAEMN